MILEHQLSIDCATSISCENVMACFVFNKILLKCNVLVSIRPLKLWQNPNYNCECRTCLSSICCRCFHCVSCCCPLITFIDFIYFLGGFSLVWFGCNLVLESLSGTLCACAWWLSFDCSESQHVSHTTLNIMTWNWMLASQAIWSHQIMCFIMSTYIWCDIFKKI